MTEWLWIIFVQWGAAATILPLSAMGAVWILRGKSAAVRHRIWTLTLAGVLLFPLLGPFLPQSEFFNPKIPVSSITSITPESENIVGKSERKWKTENDFSRSTLTSRVLKEVDDFQSGSGENSTLVDTLPMKSVTDPVTTDVAPTVSPFRLDVSRAIPFLLTVWLLGAAILFYSLWRSVRYAVRLCRDASPVEGEWSQLADEIRGRFRIRRPIRFLVSESVSVPMVIGFFRQAILFPCHCNDWSKAEARSILLHEFSHCRRCDPFWLLLARVTSALCWFHPLVWYVSRQMKIEREFACDDAVLLSGEYSDVYASTLFNVAVQAVEIGGCPVLGVAMTRRQSRINERIASILDTRRNRRPISRLGRAFSLMFVIVAIVIIAQIVPPLPTSGASVTAADKAAGNKTVRSESDKDSSVVKSENTLTLHVIDNKGKPVANAKGYHYCGNKTFFTTDDAGQVVIDLNKDPLWRARFQMIVEIHEPDYASAGAMFLLNSPIPTDFTIVLNPAERIGGCLVDEKGKPLSDIEVEVGTGFGTTYDIGEGYTTVERVKTDTEGRWMVATLPKDKTGTVSVVFKRANYPEYSVWIDVNELKTQREGRFVRRDSYPDGITVTGKVIGPNDEPVPGATVWGNHNGFQKERFEKTTADESGRFQFDHWLSSEAGYVIANAKGFGPALVEKIEIKPGMEPVTLHLTKAGVLKFRIVDPNGNPVPNFKVAFDTLRDYRMMEGFLLDGNNRFGKTDSEGRYVWKSAPEEKVKINFYDTQRPARFSDKRDGWFTAQDEEYVVKLNPVLTVSGRVTDKATGETIPHFTTTLGECQANNNVFWDFFNVPRQVSSDGTFRLTRSDLQDDRSSIVRIVAEGYYPAVSRMIKCDEGTVTVDFELEKMASDKLIRGSIVDEKGKSLSGVKIEMATRNHCPLIRNGQLGNLNPTWQAMSDKHGRFTMPYVDLAAENKGHQPRSEGDYKLVFISPNGFNIMTQLEFEALGNQPVRLKRWGGLTGIMKIGTRPAASQAFVIAPAQRNELLMVDAIRIFWQLEGKTDNEGRFTFNHIPPGKGKISRRIMFAQSPKGYSSVLTDSTDYRVEAGQNVEVTLGGTGRPLIGKLAVPDDFPLVPDWNYAYVLCDMISNEEMVKQSKLAAFQKEMMPPELLKLLKEKSPEAEQKYTEWRATNAGKVFQKRREEINFELKKQPEELRKAFDNRRSFTASVEKDGSFRMEGVPSGKVSLNVSLWQPSANCLPEETIAQLLNYHMTLPSLPEGKTVSEEPFDVGQIVLKKTKQPVEIGQIVPEWSAKVWRLNGKTWKKDETAVSSKSLRGKYIIFDFWATWCGPCINALPEMKTLYESRIKNDSRLVLIGVCQESESESNVVHKVVEKVGVHWPQIFGPEFVNTLGVKNSQSILVIATDGKAVFFKRGGSPKDLANWLDTLPGSDPEIRTSEVNNTITSKEKIKKE